MIISIVNHTNLYRQDVQDVIRAVNRQLAEDFNRYWHKDVELRLEGWTGEQPNLDMPLDLRGDAVIYLWDQMDVDGALGYHTISGAGIPYGFVFTELSRMLGEPWSVTLSHEALELAMDTEINLLAQGPHPDPEQHGRVVYHWYELRDAVQADTYRIDGIEVSNFVLPLYFTESEEHKNHNDFLGLSLASFGLRPGSYVGYFDPQTSRHETYSRPDDDVARERAELKAAFSAGKRSMRRRGGVGLLNRDSRVACEAIVFELSTANATRRDTRAAELGEKLGPGWLVRPCAADPAEFDAIFKGRSTRRPNFAEAWALCHMLADEVDVTWAEPSFVVPVVGEHDDAPRAACRAQSVFENAPDKQGTGNPLWAVEQCRVPEAWAWLEKQGLRPGNGIRIGHLDSGYIPHTELDANQVDTSSDRDFLDDDDDASTPGSRHGSHGLATGSVIMSGKSGRMVGPAFGAELVPLRVTKPGFLRPTPVLLLAGMRRVRDAIDYAVGAGCEVVSMSLGGLPHSGLEKALKRARDAGVMTVAAAGNEVGMVVWSARYTETVAVGGTTVDRGPWSGSSRGSAVNVSAPAESVWRAFVDDDGQVDIGRSSGTSYATALTAGIAAMWYAYHGEALAERDPKEIPALFREAVARTAQTDHSLPPDLFGAGIVNAIGVLQRALPSALPPEPVLSAQDSLAAGHMRGISDLSLRRELQSAEALTALLTPTAWMRSARRAATGTRSPRLLGMSDRLNDTLHAASHR